MSKEILRVPFHSFIDVITNSSTEIYVGCGSHTIVAMKDLLGEILKVAGVKETVDDLFEFEIKYEDEPIAKLEHGAWRCNYCDDEFDLEEDARTCWDDHHDDIPDERHLIIKSKKDDISIDLVKTIRGIFEINVRYDG